MLVLSQAHLCLWGQRFVEYEYNSFDRFIPLQSQWSDGRIDLNVSDIVGNWNGYTFSVDELAPERMANGLAIWDHGSGTVRSDQHISFQASDWMSAYNLNLQEVRLLFEDRRYAIQSGPSGYRGFSHAYNNLLYYASDSLVYLPQPVLDTLVIWNRETPLLCDTELDRKAIIRSGRPVADRLTFTELSKINGRYRATSLQVDGVARPDRLWPRFSSWVFRKGYNVLSANRPVDGAYVLEFREDLSEATWYAGAPGPQEYTFLSPDRAIVKVSDEAEGFVIGSVTDDFHVSGDRYAGTLYSFTAYGNDGGYYAIVGTSRLAQGTLSSRAILLFDRSLSLEAAYVLPTFGGFSAVHHEQGRGWLLLGALSPTYAEISLSEEELRGLVPYCIRPEPYDWQPIEQRSVTLTEVEKLRTEVLAYRPLDTVLTPVDVRTEALTDYRVALIPQDTICEVYTPLFQPAQPDAIVGVRWKGSPVASLSSPVSLPLGETGELEVDVDFFGCPLTFRERIYVAQPQDLYIQLDRVFNCTAQSASLRAIAEIENTRFTWSTGDTTASLDIREGGTYTVSADGGACASEAQFELELEDCPPPPSPPEIPFPTAFSPNGDGSNDRFRLPAGVAVRVLELGVYDRWGNQIARTTGEAGWDGTFRGRPAPQGTYVFRAVVRREDLGEAEAVSGQVTLLR